MPEEKKRLWYVAGLLSLLMSGLGQIYNGQGKKGVILMVLMLSLSLAVTQSSLTTSFAGLVLSFSAILALYGYALMDALLGSRRMQSIPLKRYNRWYVYPCIFLLHALIIPPLLEWNKAVDTYVIKSSAMNNSLLAGDYLAAARDYTPAFQDVVVFKYPSDPSLNFVMRLIGLPGDTIKIKDKTVRRNGVILVEPYARHVDRRVIPVVCEAPPKANPWVAPAGTTSRPSRCRRAGTSSWATTATRPRIHAASAWFKKKTSSARPCMCISLRI